jgi:cell division protein FtsW (lipid II flippase)
MIDAMQSRLKESSRSFGLLALKVATGLIVGLTFSLILKELNDIGNFLFAFVIVLTTAVFLKLSQKWKLSGVMLFMLFYVMTAMLLRMYILIAPGE